MGQPAVKEKVPEWIELCEKVAETEDRILFEYKGKKLALIAAEDLEFLEALEDRYDNEECDRILQEMKEKGEKPIPYEQIRRELGLE